MSGPEYAYFYVTGPGTHELVTDILDLAPTAARNVGEVDPSTGRLCRFMRWELHSGLEHSAPLIQHIDALFLYLGPRANELRSLWLEYDLTLQAVGYYSGSHGLHLSREHVRKAAALGVALDLDLYTTDA